MICPICKQDSICIDLSDTRYFKCSVCKENFGELSGLLKINIKLEEAYIEGKQAFREEGSTNPYKDSEKGEDPILSRSWKKGYTEEKEGYELEALLISSEKLKEIEERDRCIYEDKILQYELLYEQIRNAIRLLKNSNLVKVPIFGRIYKKRVEKLLEEIFDLYKEKIIK